MNSLSYEQEQDWLRLWRRAVRTENALKLAEADSRASGLPYPMTLRREAEKACKEFATYTDRMAQEKAHERA